LLNSVGHDADEAGALDGLGQLALLLGRNGGDAARNDLAALRHVTRQQAHVLVVDPWRAFTRERAGLAAALERTAGLGGGEVFDCHSFSVPVLETARSAFAAKAAAITATTTFTALVAVTLLHHCRRAFFQLVHAHGHEAQNVFIDAHLALHLGNGSSRSFDVEQRVMRLAVLANAVGEALEAPIF